eukprot:1139137-Pelagomonas_calceolata.AAC.3
MPQVIPMLKHATGHLHAQACHRSSPCSSMLQVISMLKHASGHLHAQACLRSSPCSSMPQVIPMLKHATGHPNAQACLRSSPCSSMPQVIPMRRHHMKAWKCMVISASLFHKHYDVAASILTKKLLKCGAWFILWVKEVNQTLESNVCIWKLNACYPKALSYTWVPICCNSAGRRGASTCACSVCGMGATAPSHGGLEVHSSHRVLQSGIAHWLCLTLPQVISILHHHMSNHHATGEYVPTDFFETAAMLVTLVLCGKYLVSAPGSERVLKDHARVQAQQANAFGLGCRS